MASATEQILGDPLVGQLQIDRLGQLLARSLQVHGLFGLQAQTAVADRYFSIDQ